MSPIVVLDPTPDERGRFYVLVDRYMEWWSIEQIRQGVAEGRDLQHRQTGSE